MPMNDKRHFDVLIIGAGVSGSAIARELARTDLKVVVLEKESDVCEGTSKANSGIIHAGFDAKPGTLKARLNVEGSQRMSALAEELHFDYRNNGSLVLCFESEQLPALEALKKQGEINGVKGLTILSREEVLEKEPYVNPEVQSALYAPSGAIVCPFGLNVALAENAADNGVRFYFDTPVFSIEKKEDGFLVNGELTCRILVNAAGVHADEIHNLICEDRMQIRPRKGEYFLLDQSAGNLCDSTLFQLPTAKGKGVLVTPTVHGNLLVGPTADFVEDKEEEGTTADGLSKVRNTALKTMTSIPFGEVITSFAGLRAVGETGDFMIEESLPGFIDVGGIESPGLSSAPAVGVMVAEMIREKLSPGENPAFNPIRKGFVHSQTLSPEEWNELIENDPEYGKIICRCETITAGQIRDACRRSVPARTLDGVKRRVRAGMGRCQGGFCSVKVMEILCEETGLSMEEISKSGKGSEFITSLVKEEAFYD